MVVLLAIVYNIPSFFEHDIVIASNDCLSRVEPQINHSAMRTNKYYFILYKTLVYFVFRFLVPLASLTFLVFSKSVTTPISVTTPTQNVTTPTKGDHAHHDHRRRRISGTGKSVSEMGLFCVQ